MKSYNYLIIGKSSGLFFIGEVTSNMSKKTVETNLNGFIDVTYMFFTTDNKKVELYDK